MLFKGKYDSVKPFYEYLNILPLSENIKQLQDKFMWKLINNCHTGCIKEQFPVTFSNTINSTKCRLTIPRLRIEAGTRTLLYQGFKLWNQEIPTLIKNQNTVKNFFKNYQENLLNNIKTLKNIFYHNFGCL